MDHLPNLREEMREIKDEKEEITTLFCCEHVDSEIVKKIAEILLPGLATACVDNTTGDLFKTPPSVAANLREEMESYLRERSESFVAEYVILEGGDPPGNLSIDPYEVVSDMVDEFSMSKRNILSRVSGWILSESREDKIDDFTQDMDLNRFWIMEKRETIAVTILKNVDVKRLFHCGERFTSQIELCKHMDLCVFKQVDCFNEGCGAVVSASRMVEHDDRCDFKVIPCEQKCSVMVMRRDMDKHCVTVCGMRMVKCPFFSVGCQQFMPYCDLNRHFSERLHSHCFCVLRMGHNKGRVPDEEIESRLCRLESISSSSKLSEARDVRTLTSFLRDLELKLESLQFHKQ